MSGYFGDYFGDFFGSGSTPPPSAWRYSDRAHVRAEIHDVNITPTWDLDDDGVEDTGAMEADGILSDAYIDRTLASAGLTVPIDVSIASTMVQQSLADIGARMTVWYGWSHRGIQEMSGLLRRSADDIAGLMSGYKTYADEELAKLVTVLRATDEEPDVRGSGAIQTSVAAPKLYPGVPVVAPAYTLPVPTSPWSY